MCKYIFIDVQIVLWQNFLIIKKKQRRYEHFKFSSKHRDFSWTKMAYSVMKTIDRNKTIFFLK